MRSERVGGKKVKRSNEPFWWALFGAGGVVAALCLPALLFMTGVAFPLGWLAAPDYESLYGLFENPLVRLAILAIVSLSAFHWAHRFRFTLYDGLHIKHLNAPVALFCYGSAIAFTGFAALSLYTF
ncbi:MAG: fumarate reductase subunit D [Bacteroidetes bacterium]|nr:fumarate reductase subunit D [Bacteroidota bacterium]